MGVEIEVGLGTLCHSESRFLLGVNCCVETQLCQKKRLFARPPVRKDGYDEQLRAADLDDISYSDFVTRLVRAQWQARQEGALEWRIRRANLPERWSLE